ncbi:MAG: PKD domain-containing protein [Flavobacteriales bacterium]|nr:PKD domain-containing protein [Flavobacteriales bacterium]
MRTLYNKSKALFLGVALACSFGAQAQSGGIPVNDLCVNATPIVCGESVTGSTVGATNTNPSTCQPTALGVWYEFVGDGNAVTISTDNPGTTFDTELSVTLTCGATTCFANDDDGGTGTTSELSFTSVNGQSYFIQVSSYNAGVGSYELSVACAAPPANDLCANAIEVFCNDAISGSTDFSSNVGAPTGIGKGVWYKYTGNNQLVTVGTCTSTSGFDTEIAVFAGDCNNRIDVGSDDDGCSPYSELSFEAWAGLDYYIYVGHWSPTAGTTGNFDLTVSCAALPVPLNDLCGSATALVCGDFFIGSTAGATATGELACTGNGDPGVWYSFVGDGTDYTISADGSGFDTYLAVSTSCGGACVAENDDIDFEGGNWASEIPNFPTVNGQTYYIYLTSVWGGSGTYLLELTSSACTPPSNDLCANAEVIECGDVVSGNTALAAAESGLGTCGTSLTTAPGVWYTYVGTGEDVTVSTCSANTTFDTKLGVFSGDCNALACVGGNDDDSGCTSSGTRSTYSFYGQAGVAYYIYVTGYLTNTGDFDLSITCNCTAAAGTLTADATPVCLDGGSADISATENAAPVVPVGYTVGYVLTSNPGLIIEQVAATPDFTVTEGGDYIIHTLVYNPITLDLSGVVLGTTSALDVLPLITQGGGSICANLDATGAPITVEAPDAGTLTADASPVCLDAGSADISATENAAPVVPAGYSVLYVLTSNPGLIIEQVAATPDFTVTEGGDYIIHTLVYNPATLDLSGVVLGTTSALDVLPSLVQGGGSICANLDAAGAPVTVEAPDAGTLTADASPVCLDAGSADISATENAAPVVPAGYSVLYVLTSNPGLIIEQVGATPDFTVTAEGDYIIHTLVYNPATLDLSGVVLGTTSALDVLPSLVQGGGSICANLDAAGAPITVELCGPANDLCSGAIAVTCGSTTSGTTVGATADATLGTCGTSLTSAPGVWYSWVSDGSDITVTTCDAADYDTKIGIFSGSCGALVCVDGNDDDFNCTGNTSTVADVATVSGETYYIYVSGFSAESGDFDLTLTCVTPPPAPSNDNVCDASALVLGANGPFSNVSATTEAGEALPGGGTGVDGSCQSQDGWCSFSLTLENSIWFTFEAPASGNVIVSTDGSDFDTQLAVYSAVSCQDLVSGTAVLEGANDDNPDATGSTLTSQVVLCGLTPGETYFVQVDGYDGEEGDALVTLTETTVDAAFTYVATGLSVAFTDASTTSSSITDYAWDFGDGNSSTDASPTNVYAADGSYTVCLTVTDANGCTSEYCEAIQVTDIPTTIAEAVERGMEVYPNPSNGQFVVEVSGVEADVQIVVLDVAGRQVYNEGVVLNNSFRKDLNLNLASGTYLLQVATLEGLVTRKIQIN